MAFMLEEDKIIVSVMIEKTKAIISTHPEKITRFLNKIKKDGVLFKKEVIPSSTVTHAET